MKLSGAQILLESLRREDVEVIFGLPGGAVLPVYDALHGFAGIRHVLVRQEAAAAFAADGYARVAGKPGVLLTTSGPAVTNLVTGLQSAYMDSIPIVAFTGQVSTHLIGRDAFQEADNIGLTRSCTKHNFLVKHTGDLARTVREAFYIARTGRPGPVHVDLPKDVLQQQAVFEYPEAIRLRGYRPPYDGHLVQIRKAAATILAARRPVLLVGGGAIAANASSEIVAFSEALGAPVTMTLMGLGAVPATHPLSLGMLGMHGCYAANMAIYHSDCVVAIGARFDDRVTGKLDEFCPEAQIVHIDVDPSSISKNVKAHVPIVGDARAVVAKLREEIRRLSNGEGDRPSRLAQWRDQLAKWQTAHPLSYEHEAATIKPQYVIEQISRLAGPDAVVTTGVGQHQMWAAQYFAFDRPRKWCTSGGLGAMGYGLPAALGAQAAMPDKLVVNIDGDGSFVMSSLELATAAESQLPVKTIILNNRYFGMVRQWQELVYGGRYSAVDLPGAPDFVKLAEAYACTGLRATRHDEVVDVLERAFAVRGPVVVDVHVDREESVYPMVMPGAANKDMLVAPPKGQPRGERDAGT